MHGEKVYDHIDHELARTYFRNSSKKNPSGKHGKPFIAPENRTRIKRFLTVFIGLGITAVLAAFFIRGGKIEFTAVKPEAPVEIPAVEPKKTGRVRSREDVAERTPESFRVFYDFEEDKNGWEIPLWAEEKQDHVAERLEHVKGMASNGRGSLKLSVRFPGGRWTAALIEIAQFLDLGNFDMISADIYAPASCPRGLKAKLILTAGKDWQWVEMSRALPVTPGEWTTIGADIAEGSIGWRRTTVDMGFRTDIRKIAIRIESNKKPAYAGPVYIDNIRLSKK
ncbi:MAG: hypothetical protein KAS86_03210 [Candidatus Omnitrophica bacterium]|nr:hypothetical protein [Candidatus Omnitrophota bacterium]